METKIEQQLLKTLDNYLNDELYVVPANVTNSFITDLLHLLGEEILTIAKLKALALVTRDSLLRQEEIKVTISEFSRLISRVFRFA